MKYLSLFSGIGGFEYGLEQSCHDFECIGFSEIDKYAKSIYKRHFPDHFDWGDVSRINTDNLPEFDLLVGGFPCQAFSVAGERRGFDDTRGTLFFEIARILRDKGPRYFLLENVPGLLYHEKGETFQTMLGILSELGYDVTWEVLNSKNFGVPQNRRRLYIKGYSRACGGGEVLSVGGDCESVEVQGRINVLGNVSPINHSCGRVYDEEGLSCTLTTKRVNVANRRIKEIGNVSSTGVSQSGRVYSVEGLSPTLCAGNSKSPVKIKNNTSKGYLDAYPGDGIDCDRINCDSRRGRVMSKCGHTVLTTRNNGTLSESGRIRRLTPLECERLQAFPDNWTLYGVNDEVISDTQRYKCCGNAVTTSVITEIMDNRFFCD